MDEKSSSKRPRSKHEKHKDSDSDRKHKKRAREEEEGKGSRKKHKHRKSKGKERGEHKVEIVDDDPNDEGMWVEKDITMDGERVRNYLFVFDVSSLLISLGPCS